MTNLSQETKWQIESFCWVWINDKIPERDPNSSPLSNHGPDGPAKTGVILFSQHFPFSPSCLVGFRFPNAARRVRSVGDIFLFGRSEGSGRKIDSCWKIAWTFIYPVMLFLWADGSGYSGWWKNVCYYFVYRAARERISAIIFIAIVTLGIFICFGFSTMIFFLLGDFMEWALWRCILKLIVIEFGKTYKIDICMLEWSIISTVPLQHYNASFVSTIAYFEALFLPS